MIIKIFAGAGEGKTTIATWLETELRRLGIEVQNSDVIQDGPALEERLAVLGNAQEPLKIEIKTIPYGAESRPKYAQDHKPS
jgi:adenylylsulfate kinase-like enzyme